MVLISQSEVVALSVALKACVREMMKFCSNNVSKIISDFHFSHRFWISTGTGSSQLLSWRQSSYRIALPSSNTGFCEDRILHLVHGQNLKVSDSIHHLTPKTCLIGRTSRSKFRLLTSLALSITGISWITSFLLDVTFVWNCCTGTSPWCSLRVRLLPQPMAPTSAHHQHRSGNGGTQQARGRTYLCCRWLWF